MWIKFSRAEKQRHTEHLKLNVKVNLYYRGYKKTFELSLSLTMHSIVSLFLPIAPTWVVRVTLLARVNSNIVLAVMSMFRTADIVNLSPLGALWASPISANLELVCPAGIFPLTKKSWRNSRSILKVSNNSGSCLRWRSTKTWLSNFNLTFWSKVSWVLSDAIAHGQLFITPLLLLSVCCQSYLCSLKFWFSNHISEKEDSQLLRKKQNHTCIGFWFLCH